MNAKYFLHPNALVETDNIGQNTKIWAFAHILAGAAIGADCNICDHTFIENQVSIGDRVTIKCGVQIWDGITIEDDVFIGPNATFTNDIFPRSKQKLNEPLKIIIQKGASIGANATILAGVTIGQNAMIGAGSVVTRSVPPNSIVIGNPAHIHGYTATDHRSPLKQKVLTDLNPLNEKDESNIGTSIRSLGIGNAAVYHFPLITDLRGSLSVIEFEENLPFPPQRSFMVFDVPTKEVRGEHAHYQCEQFLICPKGKVTVLVDNGVHREEILLDQPHRGVYIPKLIWSTQYNYSADAVLFVFASEKYDSADYIRDYNDYIKVVGSPKK